MNPFSVNSIVDFRFDGLIWKAKIPTPRQNREIDVEVSKRLGGVPVHSVPEATYNYTAICVTLNRCIIDYPEEYKHLTDWEDYPDMEAVLELHGEFSKQQERFYEELSRLKKNKGSSIHSSRNSGILDTVQDEPDSESRRPIPRTNDSDNASGNGTGGFQPHTGEKRETRKARLVN